MINTPNLKAAEEVIEQNIVQNGVKAITAEIMHDVLIEMTTAAEKDIEAAATATIESVYSMVFETKNYGNLSVTTPKIADSAVTTTKIADYAVTKRKLSSEVTDYLLTPQMKEYLLEKINSDLQREAQEKFVGSTVNGGSSVFVYGEVTPYYAGKTVYVSLTFDGEMVEADMTPCGWIYDNGVYSYKLSLVDDKKNVPATIFTYTPNTGKYSGCTVIYESEAASVEWTDPVFYGFVLENRESAINTRLVNSLIYSTEDVINPSATLENNLDEDAYLCIMTKNEATATQIGISVIDCPKSAPNFTSPKNPSVTMSGYKVYFSKNTVAAGSSLGNVNLSILK